MAHNDIEIEIQVNVENVDKLLDFLKDNAKFISEKHQDDEYFSPEHKDFLAKRPVEEWLRLRDADGQYSIVYKNWYSDKDGRGNHCDEYETKLDDIEQARKILLVLDFKSIAKVDKIRNTWIYKDYEIAIDSVKNLGEFVELEYIGKDNNADPKVIADEMVSLLKKIDCGKITRNYVGYPFLVLFPDEAKYEIL